MPPWATLITSQFLHAGIGHLLGNVLYLWIFGRGVESAPGACAISCSISPAAWSPP
jgi:membrane associated rhomboid family serine protease